MPAPPRLRSFMRRWLFVCSAMATQSLVGCVGSIDERVGDDRDPWSDGESPGQSQAGGASGARTDAGLRPGNAPSAGGGGFVPTEAAAGSGGVAGSAGVAGSVGLAGAGGPNRGGMNGSAGGSSAGSGGDGVCPAEPPFDESNQALVAECTRPIVVAVGNGLRRALSHDGTTWFGDVWFPGGGDENEQSHRGVAIGNGIIVIVGDGGILTSRDGGLTFVKKDTGRSLHNSAVVFFQNAFWVAGSGVHTTKDGLTWQSWKDSETLPGGLRASFGATDAESDLEKAIFVNRSSYRRFDGNTWTEGPVPNGSAERITLGNGRFAAVSSFGGQSAASTNGTAWSGGMGGLRFGDVAWDGSRFFASSSRFDPNGQTSTDGLTWTKYRMSTGIDAVARHDGILVGSNGATLYRSTDGRMWTAPHAAAGDNKWGFTSIRSGRVLARPVR